MAATGLTTVETVLDRRGEVSPEPSLLDGLSGPAIIVSRDGALVAHNDKAAPLLDALRRNDPPLRQAIAEVRQFGGSKQLRVASNHGDVTYFDTTVLPFVVPGLDEPSAILLLARDNTLEWNLINALVASRGLYKDLVECSSEFAWETDRNGRFNYVSPRGYLGYSAKDLEGRLAIDFRHANQGPEAPFPFTSSEPWDDAEVWYQRSNGDAACLLVSSVPLFNDDNEWIGGRGVCRDISQARARDQALAQAQNREDLINKIADVIRGELDPSRMLPRAAFLIASTLYAAQAWFLRSNGNGLLVPILALGERGDKAIDEAIAGSIAAVQTGRGFRPDIVFETDQYRGLAYLSDYHGEVNGAICIARPASAQPFAEEDRAIMSEIAKHLGMAVAQLSYQEQLAHMSRVDDLTGLGNRRAFNEDVGRRLSHLRRHRRRGAILFIDLDNFKTVNDHLGHDKGDELLRRIGEKISGNIRVGDIAARLGGDEFVIWLEETGPRGAEAKAHRLLHDLEFASDYTVDPARPISMSIGVAVSDYKINQSVADLIRRADHAMYQVKRAGKRGIAVASENNAAEDGSAE